MKKRICSLFLAMCLVLSLTGTALAANQATNSKATTIKGPDGSEVSFVTITDSNGKTDDNSKVSVTYKGNGIVAGQQYLVLMVSDSKVELDSDMATYPVATPTDSNILYIDQKAADATGSITFEVYPKSLTTGIILITGVDKDGNPQKLIAAIVKAQYIIGDADGDGAVSATDAALVLRVAAKLSVTKFVEAAADVDGSSSISATDAALILRIAAKLQ